MLSNYFADPWEENNNCNWCKQGFFYYILIVKSFKWVIASYSVPNYMSQVYFLKIASDLNGQANVICFATI